MRKLQVLLILILVISLVGCNSSTVDDVNNEKQEEVAKQNQPTESNDEPKEESNQMIENTVFNQDHSYQIQYKIWDILDEVFTSDQLTEIGADGFSGTEEEIANQIYDWQTTHMEFAGVDDSFFDAGYGSRWNAIIPGIYPASKRIKHLTDDNKIYGICYDFSYIYCAIAKSYGLDCRVTIYTYDTYEKNNGPHPWLADENSFRGLGRDEYELLKVELDKEGINLTYDQVHRAIQGYSLIEGHVQGPHGRAEVKINGEWNAFDATVFFNGVPSKVDLNPDNYTVLNWDGIYNPIRLYAPEFQDSAVAHAKINFEAIGEYLSYGPQVLYSMGITDDYGNKNRAHSFDAFVRGDGLLPYVNSTKGLSEYLKIPMADLADEGYDEMLADFYDETGRPFNIIADFLIFEDEDMSAADYIKKYNAITGDNLSEDEFNNYVK